MPAVIVVRWYRNFLRRCRLFPILTVSVCCRRQLFRPPPPPTSPTIPAPGDGGGTTDPDSGLVCCTSACGFTLCLSPAQLDIRVSLSLPLAFLGVSPSFDYSSMSSISSSSSEGALLEDTGLLSSCTACTNAIKISLSMVMLSVFSLLFPRLSAGIVSLLPSLWGSPLRDRLSPSPPVPFAS